MRKKLCAVHTILNFDEVINTPFVQKFADAHKEEVEVFNIMDDSLLSDTRADGMNARIAHRMLCYAKAAEGSGADGVIVTCTSVNEATKMIRPLLRIPIINIEEPTAEAAAKTGGKIGILATVATSPAAIGRVIEEKAAESGKEVTLIPRVVEGAFELLCAGKRDEHDKQVRAALYELAKEVDCVVFAQISMSLLTHDEIGVPLYKIGFPGLEKILSLMEENSR